MKTADAKRSIGGIRDSFESDSAEEIATGASGLRRAGHGLASAAMVPGWADLRSQTRRRAPRGARMEAADAEDCIIDGRDLQEGRRLGRDPPGPRV